MSSSNNAAIYAPEKIEYEAFVQTFQTTLSFS